MISDIEKSRYEKKIAEQENIIADLDNQLRQVMEISKSCSEQEIMTFKRKITMALKFEYENYCLCNPENFNEENFKANYAGLQHVFNILKRFGITFE